jgi:hypothetical protein
LAGERIPHSVHIPLGGESIVEPSGLQAAGDRTSHQVFIFCGFAQASADRVFIESGPKTAAIRTCLATQREISVLREKKKVTLFCPPLLPPLSTLPSRFPYFKVFQNLLELRKKVMFF